MTAFFNGVLSYAKLKKFSRTLLAVNICAIGTCNENARKKYVPERFQQVPESIGRRFMCFPLKFPKMCERWMYLTGRLKQNLKNVENLQVCSRHFEGRHYKKSVLDRYEKRGLKVPNNVRVLNDDAEPTLHLFEPIEQNPDREIQLRKDCERAARVNQRMKQSVLDTESSSINKPRQVEMMPCEPGKNTNTSEFDTTTVEEISFESNCQPNSQRDYLEPSATLKRLVAKVYGNKDLETALTNTSAHGETVTNSFIRDIMKKLKDMEEAGKKKQMELDENKKTILNLQKHQEKISIELKTALSKNEAIKESVEKHLSKAQIDRLMYSKRSCWSANDFASALIVLAAGKRGYTYINAQYTFLLPCLSSIKSYMANISFEPGQLDDVLSLMAFAAKDYTPLEKLLVMSYDEMHTAQSCCYDQKLDQVLGPCSQVQVVNVRGLFSSFKNPIFYDFDCKIDGWPEKLAEELHKRGFLLVAIVCDLGTNNQKFFRQAGVSFDKPYFAHPVTGQPIFCLFDPPHNLKLARNYLLDEEIHLEPSSDSRRVASVAPLLELVNLPAIPDMKRHKVRLEHLTVKGSERQNVLKACQVASESTSIALLEAGQRGLIKAPNYEATAEYLYVLNQYMDIFNVKVDPRIAEPNKIHPPQKLPFGAALEEQKAILLKVQSMISKMRVGKRKGLLPFQEAIILSCKSLIALYEALKEMFPEEKIEISTYFLNQDVIEQLFALFRMLGGTKTHPSPVEVKYRIRNVLLGRNPELLLEGKNTNTTPCRTDNGSQILSLEAMHSICNLREEQDNSEAPKNDSVSADPTDENEEDPPSNTCVESTSSEDSSCIISDEEENETRLTADSPSNDPFYKDGLRCFAEKLAGKFRLKYPYLESTSENMDETHWPIWIDCIKKLDGAKPSSALLEMVRKMDKAFLIQHGLEVDRKRDVMKRFQQNVVDSEPYIPVDVVKHFCFLRLKTRRKAIEEQIILMKHNRRQTRKATKRSKDLQKQSRNAKRMKILVK